MRKKSFLNCFRDIFREGGREPKVGLLTRRDEKGNDHICNTADDVVALKIQTSVNNRVCFIQSYSWYVCIDAYVAIIKFIIVYNTAAHGAEYASQLSRQCC